MEVTNKAQNERGAFEGRDILQKIKLETQEKLMSINENIKNKTMFAKIYLAFKRAQMVKLKQMAVGKHMIVGVLETLTDFGKNYLLLFENGRSYTKCYVNKHLEKAIEGMIPYVTLEHSILYSSGNSVGTLQINGKKQLKESDRLLVLCHITWSHEMQSLVAKTVDRKYTEVEEDEKISHIE